MKEIGLGINSLFWFESNLKKRKYKVVNEIQMSVERYFKHGVPQGSILGPILFSIYVNNIAKVIEKYDFQYHIYADDIQIYVNCEANKFQEIKHQLEDLVSECIRWLCLNKLKVNENKTQYIVYGKKNILNQLDLDKFKSGNVYINPSSFIKNIGFIFDKYYQLKEQIISITKSCRIQIYRMWKIRRYLTKHSTQLLVNSLIFSKLDFQISLLYELPNSRIKEINSVFGSAIRLIFNIKKYNELSTSYLCSKLRLLPIKYRIEFRLISIIKKCLIHKQPQYLYQIISTRNNKLSVELRNSQRNIPY